jgi:hypothetical protein
MNLYFISLLKIEVERKKNIACSYFILNRTKKGTSSKYLKTRFPFLKEGDQVKITNNKTRTPYFFFNNKLVIDVPKKFVSHPYFFLYVNQVQKIAPISKKDRTMISEQYKKKGFKVFGVNEYLVPLVKIGKMRYNILFYKINFEELIPFLIEKNMNGAWILCDPISHPETYDSRFKKRLDVHFWG